MSWFSMYKAIQFYYFCASQICLHCTYIICYALVVITLQDFKILAVKVDPNTDPDRNSNPYFDLKSAIIIVYNVFTINDLSISTKYF
jgi:hypothetical protein